MDPNVLRERLFGALPRFRCLEALGHGGFGTVFRVLDLETGYLLALKVFDPPTGEREAELLARFRREIECNRRIDHPNVTRLFESGWAGGLPWVVMEFVPGRTLRQLLDEEGPMGLEPRLAARIVREAAEGVEAAHRVGVLHRDLKPSNLIVREQGGVSVLDFGFAPGGDAAPITRPSEVFGTVSYLAPERALGGPATERSDVYSLGVIAFEALTGHRPFDGTSPVQVAMRHVHDPVPDDLSVFPGVPPLLREAVHRALAKRPGERHASALALAEALAPFDP